MAAVSRDAILNRFNSIMQTMEIKAGEINSSKIVGVWNTNFPKLFKSLFYSLKKDIDRLDTIVATEEQKLRILEKLNPHLDLIVSLHDVVVNTNCKNTAIHEFVSYVFRDLGLEKKIPYLICVRDSLETFPIIKTWKAVFVGDETFPNVNDVLDEYDKKNGEEEQSGAGIYHNFYIIYIPPSILQKKIYWSLIVHEIAHTVIDYYNLIERYYPEMPTEMLDTEPGKKYFHSREYLSDYIANMYLGPVFYESLYEYVFVNRMKKVSTHPSWDSRLYFLQEKVETNTKKRVENIPPENHTAIEEIDNIVLNTISRAFGGEGRIYKKEQEKLREAADYLKQMLPYVDSPRIILNSYLENQKDILSSLKIQESPAIQENKIGQIIEDSVRISNMKRTYDVMASAFPN